MAKFDPTDDPGRDSDSRCAGGGRRYGRGPGRGALVEPAALAVLVRREGHGYDIRRDIKEDTGGAIEVDVGGLYRVLRRLEEEGFVEAETEESDVGPQRRVYRLTAEGRELAEDWVCHLRERRRLAGILLERLEQALAGDFDTSGSAVVDLPADIAKEA